MSKPERTLEPSIVAEDSTAQTPRIVRSAARLAGPNEAAIPSPARLLQLKLVASAVAEPEGDDGVRWAPAVTLLCACGVSTLIWGAIALAVGARL